MTSQHRRTARSLVLLSLAAALHTAAVRAESGGPLDPQFSYQGRLNDAAGPATGLFDLRFDLYNQATGGGQIGSSAFRPAVSATGGFFTVDLDFGGPALFNGDGRWLEIFVRPAGTTAPYVRLDPRQRIAPVPYALRALTANTVLPGSINSTHLAPGSIDGSRLAPGAVDSSRLYTTGAAPSGGSVLTWDAPSGAFRWAAPASQAWQLGGNAGTNPATQFIGTSDNVPLVLRAGNVRSLELRSVSRLFGAPFATSGEDSMNLLAGSSYNTISSGTIGAVIAGGGGLTWDSFFGSTAYPNSTQSDYSTISGGRDNSLYGDSTGGVIGGGTGNRLFGGSPGSVIPGGEGNFIHFAAPGSFAAGTRAHALFAGSFVWSDRQPGDFYNSAENQCAIRAAGGLHLESNKGITQNASDSPIITRGWDPFGSSAGDKSGHGRWGLFMEPFNLVCGIPDVAGRGFEVAKYKTDGTRSALFTVGQNGAVWSNSSASFTTVTIRGGADLAEPFDTGEEIIPPGSVVVIDGDGTGKLARSTTACDTRVAGVVSGANGIHPGLCLSQEGVNEDGTKVALTGRVYCLCDAASAAIQPGDLLTTAATPGHAMKAPRGDAARGAILGKAMSSLAKGEKGHVLILVTLQ